MAVVLGPAAQPVRHHAAVHRRPRPASGTSTSPAARSSCPIRASSSGRPASTPPPTEIGADRDGRVVGRLPALPPRPRGGHARVRGPGRRDELPHGQGPAAATRPTAERGERATRSERAVPEDYELQTGRAITLSVRQVKGTHIADYDRDMTAAVAELKLLLPPDLRLERTSNEPEEVHHKIHGFNKNLIEAIVIVVLVSLVFMEWRSALLVAICHPDHGRDDPGPVAAGRDRPPAGLDRGADHRAGAAGGRPGRRGRRDQPRAGARPAASTSRRGSGPSGWPTRSSTRR